VYTKPLFFANSHWIRLSQLRAATEAAHAAERWCEDGNLNFAELPFFSGGQILIEPVFFAYFP
jgi:hypothetical protein